MAAPISVVLIEDNRLLRDAITQLLASQPDVALVGAAASGEAALRASDATRTAGDRPHRRGAEQQRNRAAVAHRDAHRQESRAQHPREAGVAYPLADSRVRPLRRRRLARSG